MEIPGNIASSAQLSARYILTRSSAGICRTSLRTVTGTSDSRDIVIFLCLRNLFSAEYLIVAGIAKIVQIC